MRNRERPEFAIYKAGELVEVRRARPEAGVQAEYEKIPAKRFTDDQSGGSLFQTETITEERVIVDGQPEHHITRVIGAKDRDGKRAEVLSRITDPLILAKLLHAMADKIHTLEGNPGGLSQAQFASFILNQIGE